MSEQQEALLKDAVSDMVLALRKVSEENRGELPQTIYGLDLVAWAQKFVVGQMEILDGGGK